MRGGLSLSDKSFPNEGAHGAFAKPSRGLRGGVKLIRSGSKRFRKNGGPHLKGSRRLQKKVAFWVHPPYEPLAVKIVLRGSKGFRVFRGTHLEGSRRLHERFMKTSRALKASAIPTEAS